MIRRRVSAGHSPMDMPDRPSPGAGEPLSDRPDKALPDPEPLLDVVTVAAQLDVSVKTVRRLIGRGDLPVYQIGKLLRVGQADLERFLVRRRGI